MVFVDSYEDFERRAEQIYLGAPMKTRCVLKYDHSKALLIAKVTDDVVCLQYRTDSHEDLRKLEKLMSNIMRHMASGER
ncbi:hypothetical protein HAZT_HAZT000722 [Hyalella azteca]|uniref:Signal recognition particle 9 kDa protein n=1 Tax=Hyalella azteca TaxID=294128 RepID=A0A6A0H298_HYAAZ|nr:signal recognition particle 9 kDa protein [Hyalella azteca]KAA0196990.1 hypothetical protein HAZT_HAZT000722 [Hyalella azteca]